MGNSGICILFPSNEKSIYKNNIVQKMSFYCWFYSFYSMWTKLAENLPLYIKSFLHLTFFSFLCRWAQLQDLWKGAHRSPSRAWTWVCHSLSWRAMWRWQVCNVPHRRRDTSLLNSKRASSPPVPGHTWIHTVLYIDILYRCKHTRENKHMQSLFLSHTIFLTDTSTVCE